jgi:alpha-glucosidase
MTEATPCGFPWWKKGIIYQIYPLSFQDTDGDGKGDIAGIIRRLDHLSDLGVSAIWLSPIYPSPMADFGYDVSDFLGIHPLFGTMDDFDRLLREIHTRGMRLILDFVPNHTSDRHPWFIESRASRDSPKRDWYLWHDPAPNGGPPNNWLGSFGGSAWEWDEKTGQYYYHAFLKEQPDLNWRNPEVREAMLSVMRFWLDKGVDGFRVDVMWHLIKDEKLRDNPPNPDYREGKPTYHRLIPAYSTDQPEVLDAVRAMRDVIDRYDERVLIGEIYLPVNELVRYYGLEAGGGDGVHLPLNFQLILLPWNAEEIFAAVGQYDASVPPYGWPNWVLGNHDKPRVASRVGREQAKVAAMMLLLLRGTPVMYYGDEIGMHDVPIRTEGRRDPAEQARDPQRTPMQWSADKHSGFTTGAPWLPVADDYRERNVEAESGDPQSLLSFYRRLIRLRQGEPALTVGSYVPVGIQGDILAFVRECDEHPDRFLVALNLSHKAGIFAAPGEFPIRGMVIFGTNPDREGAEIRQEFRLQGEEGIVVLLERDEKRKGAAESPATP